MDKKGKYLVLNKYFILGILIFAFLVTGTTYSYYAYSYQNSSVIKGNVISVDATLTVDLVVGDNSDLVPLKDTALSNALTGTGSPNGACVDANENLSCQVYKITLTNNGSRLSDLRGTVRLYAKNASSTYTNLKWRELSNTTSIKTDSIINGMDESILINNLTLDTDESVTYYIAVYIQETDGDQTNTDKGEFEGIVTFTTVNTNLREIIAKDAQIDEDISFTNISSATNGEGVYIRSGTENDTNPIYYYRGNVNNNNIIFANTCFKIVRTTDTGGTKLIYNGVPDASGGCTATGTSTQLTTRAFNSNYTSLSDVGYMYGTRYAYTSKSMSSVTDTYYYGKDVEYREDGKYYLTDTISSSSWSSVYNGGLNNAHYTCFTEESCTSVYYVYYTSSSTMYYITLTGGEKIETAISKMLDVNNASSTIKGNDSTSNTLDYWYYKNIYEKGYYNQVEDTVWCYDRTITNYGGWNPDGGSTTSYLYFRPYTNRSNGTPSLTCSRDVDKYTVSDSLGNGNLTYPVGLLTGDEIMLAGGTSSSNSNYYIYTGQNWWSGSPSVFIGSSAYVLYVNSSGYLDYSRVYYSVGARPSISLKPGTTVINGDGSNLFPYVVE